jgi:uncharacterized membrane protein YgaE (UPF0421/DUF939 family)
MAEGTSYRRVQPQDHFSPARAKLAELTHRVTALRKEMPLHCRLASGAQSGAISAAAALIAYVPMRALGLSQDFWSAITAIAVVQSEFRATQTTAFDQFLGAALGGIAGLATLLILGQHLLVYAFAVVVAMITCSVLNVPSASRLAGITATIILLVPHVGSPVRMFFSRVAEVGWGVLVAVSVVWLAVRLPARWWLRS